MISAAVITFPGSNCDDDLVYVLAKSGFEVTRLWHKDHPSLEKFKLVCIPGGFSYGDYLRTGAMAAHSPIMEEVKKYAASGGMVLGICNGFQILCESGLLPGALARNEGLGFICRDVSLRVSSIDNAWTHEFSPNEEVVFPIAHGEGRFIVSEAQYQELKKSNQILFEYCENPNGSIHCVAGICNEKKNVMGLMPHPERATFLRSQHGQRFWSGIAKAMESAK